LLYSRKLDQRVSQWVLWRRIECHCRKQFSNKTNIVSKNKPCTAQRMIGNIWLGRASHWNLVVEYRVLW